MCRPVCYRSIREAGRAGEGAFGAQKELLGSDAFGLNKPFSPQEGAPMVTIVVPPAP
jgi:hypothetical protein